MGFKTRTYGRISPFAQDAWQSGVIQFDFILFLLKERARRYTRLPLRPLFDGPADWPWLHQPQARQHHWLWRDWLSEYAVRVR